MNSAIFSISILSILLLIVIVIATYLFAKNRELAKERIAGNEKTILPIRLRAYERIAILLNRLKPKNLISDKANTALSAKDLRDILLSDMSSELNHNSSQRIYVSELLWSAIEDVEEDIKELIDEAYKKCNPNNNSLFLANMIMEVFDTQEETSIDIAMRELNREVKRLF